MTDRTASLRQRVWVIGGSIAGLIVAKRLAKKNL
jgi:flavin-dependent dehydrogenase